VEPGYIGRLGRQSEFTSGALPSIANGRRRGHRLDHHHAPASITPRPPPPPPGSAAVVLHSARRQTTAPAATAKALSWAGFR